MTTFRRIGGVRSRLSACGVTALAAFLMGCNTGSEGPAGRKDAAVDFDPALSMSEFRPTPCWFPIAADLDIRCGLVSVPAYHDRIDDGDSAVPSAGNDRLDLAVTVFPAVDGLGSRPPVIFLDGGPGEIAFYDDQDGHDPLDEWLYIADIVGQNRDFIVFDQRGVGFSTPSLDCPELEQVAPFSPATGIDLRDREGLLAAETDAIVACRDRLGGEGIDFQAFTTPASARDVFAIADALGAERFALMGVSYGTRLALEVMRLDGTGSGRQGRVEAVILDSVYPPEINLYDELIDIYERAFGAVIDACAADTDCAAVYPDFGSDLAGLVAALRDDPIAVSLVNEKTGAVERQVLLDDAAVIEGLFVVLYEADLIGGLPSLIDAAADGQPELLAEYADYLFLGSPTSSEAQYLSVECRESVWTADDAVVQAGIAGSAVFGNAAAMHWTQMQDICAAWGLAASEPASGVASDIPTLILAGRFDPVTPVRWARQAARRLPNAAVVEFPDGSHSVISSHPCALKTAAHFLQQGDADHPCLKDRQPISFITDRQFLP